MTINPVLVRLIVHERIRTVQRGAKQSPSR
jgi:hypothetical protein